MISTVRRALPVPVVTLALTLALVSCTSGGDSPDVDVPAPEGEAARACRELARDLPDRVAGQERGTLDQDTPYAAAWGDPAIVLRCGVPRPEVITPGSETYDPYGTDSFEMDGVSWLLEEEPDGVRATTTGRRVFVEVTMPDDYETVGNPLVDLVNAVDEHIPLDPLYEEPE
ncbi:DUF3515 domain-containing protein [Streptomyces sp. 6N223]|uniref:DUF3515 domain-containing protein n=1 Tax=Streptomyces sp. 6N223 TaxID=3457412 RepID=UPI003FD0E5C5